MGEIGDVIGGKIDPADPKNRSADEGLSHWRPVQRWGQPDAAAERRNLARKRVEANT